MNFSAGAGRDWFNGCGIARGWGSRWASERRHERVVVFREQHENNTLPGEIARKSRFAAPKCEVILQ